MIMWSECRRRWLLRLQKERAADELLRSSGAIRYSGGVWTQRQLNRKIREQETFLSELDINESCDVDDMVLDSMYTRLAALAHLNPLYVEVFRLHINGFTSSEISRMLTVGRLRVRRIIKKCKHKLGEVYQEDPYAGWYSVYLSEVRRR